MAVPFRSSSARSAHSNKEQIAVLPLPEKCARLAKQSTRAGTADSELGASTNLTTKIGFVFDVRAVRPADEGLLEQFFTHVTLEDIRFRFLTSVQHVGHAQLSSLLAVDHRRTENFLASDPASGALIATAMIVADAALKSAEVAIAIRADFKHRGVGWSLLEFVARYAQAKGFLTIESIESRDNHQAIALEREMGFVTLPCPGDPTLVIVRKTFDLDDAA